MQVELLRDLSPPWRHRTKNIPEQQAWKPLFSFCGAFDFVCKDPNMTSDVPSL